MINMKNSEILWIGSIPENWKVMRLKHTSWLKGRIGWDGLKATEYKDEGPYLVTGTDFENGVVNWDTCVHITKERFDEDVELHVREGDLLITKDGTIGKVAMVVDAPKEISLNSGIMIVRNISKYKYNQRFMFYVLQSSEFKEWFSYSQKPGSTIKHLYQHQFANFKYAFPPMEEQLVISDYLDSKCAKVDEAISRHNAIIAKLEEYRKSVITQAVTKGLNPNVQMKDSGLQWLGFIPKHWTLPKIKHHAEFINGDRSDNYPSGDDIVKEGITFLTTDNIHDLVLDCNREKTKYITEEKYNSLRGAKIQHNDIIFCLRGSLGACAINKSLDKGTVASSLTVIRHNNDTSPDYLNYSFHSDNTTKQTDLSMNGSCAANLSAADVRNYYFVYPPLEEQYEIVAYLDSKCYKVDEAIARQNEAIAKLEEYKKSIIYAAVTGKIDCRKEES